MKRRCEKIFRCIHCQKDIGNQALGTRFRNHCPYCLWSKHLDTLPGDRKAGCGGAMTPIGLTFKAAGKEKIGELMVVHLCQKCGARSKTRLAGDDQASTILFVYQNSSKMQPVVELDDGLAKQSIRLLGEGDRQEVFTQLFGKPNLN